MIAQYALLPGYQSFARTTAHRGAPPYLIGNAYIQAHGVGLNHAHGRTTSSVLCLPTYPMLNVVCCHSAPMTISIISKHRRSNLLVIKSFGTNAPKISASKSRQASLHLLRSPHHVVYHGTRSQLITHLPKQRLIFRTTLKSLS